MSYTEPNFIDGQVLTASDMNNIVEGLSRKEITYESITGLSGPVKCSLRPLNERKDFFIGLADVNVGKLSGQTISVARFNSPALILNISEIVHALGDAVKQIADGSIDPDRGTVYFDNQKLRISDSASFFSSIQFSWDASRGYLSAFTSEGSSTNLMQSYIADSNLTSTQIRNTITAIAQSTETIFSFYFYLYCLTPQ